MINLSYFLFSCIENIENLVTALLAIHINPMVFFDDFFYLNFFDEFFYLNGSLHHYDFFKPSVEHEINKDRIEILLQNQ